MSKKVLFIAAIFPEPGSSAAGTRMVQLIQFFIKNGYQVVFASTSEKTAYSFDLLKIGVETILLKVNDSEADEHFKSINPDIVIFDRFYIEEQFGWRIAETCPNAIRILDTEDLHFIRKSRESLQKNKADEEITKHRELAAIFRSDLSLIISKFEFDYLLQHYPESKNRLYYLPFLYKNSDKKVKSFDERKELVFIGNGLHEPNVDAIMYLKYEIWPLVRQQDNTLELSIYGAYLPEKVMQLHLEKEGFLVRGRADDALQVIENARVLFAPLRFGAGLKGKLIEAMLCGTPSITTVIGSEGIVKEVDEWPGFICDEPEDMANQLVELYTNAERWQSCQKKAQNILQERFDKQKHEALLTEVIQAKLNNLSSLREKNYIGAMLTQQTTSAAKFMSKWIEEKNKSK
jgi:O-antigen biosynthesis protein